MCVASTGFDFPEQLHSAWPSKCIPGSGNPSDVAMLITYAWFVTRVLLAVHEFRHACAPCVPVVRVIHAVQTLSDGALGLVLRRL